MMDSPADNLLPSWPLKDMLSVWFHRTIQPLLLGQVMNLASLVAQLVKNLPAMQETLVRFLGWEVPLEKG